MVFDISDLAISIPASETMRINGIVKELKARNERIINLSVGEPDFDIPNEAKNGAIKALEKNYTKYTENAGIMELREGIAKKLSKENGLSYSADHIIVCNGAKQALAEAILSVINPGDSFLLLRPYWVTYREQVRLARGNPVIIDTDRDFTLDIGNIKKAIDGRTKGIIINSPNNPTGAVYEKSDLEAVGDLAVEKDLLIISDEIYEKEIYEGKHYSIASLSEKFAERTITINGFSKSHAMTGLRIGYAAGPLNVIKAMANIQSHMTSNVSSIVQYAALDALNADTTHMVRSLKKRRDLAFVEISKVSGLKTIKPKGAFYIFADATDFLGETGMDDTQFAEQLLIDEHVAVVPGTAFGMPGFIRISYAVNENDIIEGIARIKGFIDKNAK